MQPFPTSLFYTAMLVGRDSSSHFPWLWLYCRPSLLLQQLHRKTWSAGSLPLHQLLLCTKFVTFHVFPSHLLSHFVTGESKWHDLHAPEIYRYKEHVVWTDKELNLKLMRNGLLTRIYAPQVKVSSILLHAPHCMVFWPSLILQLLPRLFAITPGFELLASWERASERDDDN